MSDAPIEFDKAKEKVQKKAELKKRKPAKRFDYLVTVVKDLLEGKIAMDTSTGSIRAIQRLPWDDKVESENEDEDGVFLLDSDKVYFRSLRSTDITFLKYYFGGKVHIDFGKGDIYDAVELVANEKTINPLASHLDALEWDGVNRIDDWLLNYCDAVGPPESIIKSISRKFLIGVAKRGLWPGTKMDTILVLEGDQGIGKSQLARALAGHDDFFSEELVDFNSPQRIIEVFAGKLIVEIPEIYSFGVHRQELLRSFLSKQTDVARRAYAREPVTVPRTFSFIGTTNNFQYLSDEAGNRRVWPIIVKNIDIYALKLVRDRLMAEAVHFARNDHDHFLDQTEEKELNEFRNTKICISDHDRPLLYFIKENYEDIQIASSGTGKVSSEWLFNWLTENNVSYSDKGLSLILRTLGASRKRTMRSRYWIFPKSENLSTT